MRTQQDVLYCLVKPMLRTQLLQRCWLDGRHSERASNVRLLSRLTHAQRKRSVIQLINSLEALYLRILPLARHPSCSIDEFVSIYKPLDNNPDRHNYTISPITFPRLCRSQIGGSQGTYTLENGLCGTRICQYEFRKSRSRFRE